MEMLPLNHWLLAGGLTVVCKWRLELKPQLEVEELSIFGLAFVKLYQK